ncbi:MAG TPA: hypothetical protein PKZ41_05260 [Candidatus Omnitrophota bacterium]|nr:hypothetical protein [Candidatus Omnitrophota bacterium]
MKNLILLSAALLFLTAPGCASSKFNLASLAGMNISDLEAAKSSGPSKTFAMTAEKAFDETLTVLRNEKLTVFRSSRKKGYIVAMGFTEQVDTTRVGIFFDTEQDGKTRVTLSCLSSLALPKAEKIIFAGLSKVSP